METLSRQLGGWARWAADRLGRAEGWQLAMVAVLVLVVLPIIPAVVLLLLVAAFVVFARAWFREFTCLMRLGDDAFPGRNDKLIWAVLLIVLAPVGVWTFRSYREARWPVAKPGRAEPFDAW